MPLATAPGNVELTEVAFGLVVSRLHLIIEQFSQSTPSYIFRLRNAIDTGCQQARSLSAMKVQDEKTTWNGKKANVSVAEEDES